MAEKMGDHSYDYDLVVIGGGSGGLVRSTFSPSPALPDPTACLSFFKTRADVSERIPRAGRSPDRPGSRRSS